MSLDNLVNSQRVYSQQIQKDVFTSNVGVNVDPVAVYPKPENTAIPSAFFQNRFEARQSGNLVAEDDLSDLNLANLTVGGEIRVPIVKADDIILNGGSLANELLQGILTTPLQVNIDANNKNITNVANFGAGRVDTSQIFGTSGPGTGGSGGLMAIRPNGISTSTPGQRAQNLQIGNAELPGNVIIETGGISGNNLRGELTLQCTQQDLPGQYNINIGTDMGVATAPKLQSINIGTANTTSANLVNNILIGNTASSNLQFFSTTNVITMSTSGGTKPSTLTGNGLDKATIDGTANAALGAAGAAAIENITQILQDYGLIQ